MMLTGARRAARSRLGHGNLDDFIEAVASMTSQQAGQTGCHACTDNNRNGSVPGRFVEIKEVTDVIERVAERHHTDTATHGFGRHHAVTTRWCGQEQHARFTQKTLCRTVSDHSIAVEGHSSFDRTGA